MCRDLTEDKTTVRMGMNIRDQVIGRVSPEYTGYRSSAALAVSVRTEYISGQHETTAHEIINGVTRLSIMAGVWNRPRTDFVMCGQIRNALDNMVAFAPGWNTGKVRRLTEIWKDWHLNDMHAGCDHQPEPLTFGACPETGYEYGAAWLVRELPLDIVPELTAMFDTA